MRLLQFQFRANDRPCDASSRITRAEYPGGTSSSQHRRDRADAGTKVDRAERHKVMALAQRREIDAVLVTELSRWGRSKEIALDPLWAHIGFTGSRHGMSTE